MVMSKTHVIIQARTSSTRFPKKVLKEIKDNSLLGLVIKRLKQASSIDKIIVATSQNPGDDLIEEIANRLRVDTFRGSLENVLDRYYYASSKYCSDVIVRITADCPLIDPKLVDAIVYEFKKNRLDYLSNTLIPEFPDGQDIEVFSFKTLKKAWELATLKSDLEHVTPFIYNNSSFFGNSMFSAANFDNKLGDYSNFRMTVDYPEDFSLIESLIYLGGTDLSWKSYVDLIIDNDLSKINNQIQRNEGYINSKKND